MQDSLIGQLRVADCPEYLLQSKLLFPQDLALSVSQSKQLIHSLEELERHYRAPRQSSRAKQSDVLTPAMQRWLAHSTFFILNTCSDDGLDCSPRGDKPGEAFQILDESTIAVPDRRGNNRIDTLRNLVIDPRIGVLFLIPGIEQALRIKGLASISISEELRQQFQLDNEPLPSTILLISIKSAFVQNARALRHAGLWDPDHYRYTDELPGAQELSDISTTKPTP